MQLKTIKILQTDYDRIVSQKGQLQKGTTEVVYLYNALHYLLKKRGD